MKHEDYRICLGKQGEQLACDALRQRGYAIIAQRYRTRSGEIDVVARDGGTLVFVEVKAKAGTACGTAREAVTRYKRRQVIAMASDYLARHRTNAKAFRFDVIAITLAAGQPPAIDVIQNAFTLDDR